MLNHLLQIKYFDNASAIILGEFTLAQEPDAKNKVEYALNRFTQHMSELHIPIFRTEQIGHGRNIYPLILGGKASICNNILETHP